jgi:hypothetical protein
MRDIVDGIRYLTYNGLLAGRASVPTAAIIDSQSVRAAEEVARSSRGYDAGKKVQAASGTSPWTPSACC